MKVNYRHETTPNVVAMAVSTVMRICMTFPQIADLLVSMGLI